MRSALAAVSFATVVALTGCAATTAVDPGDQEACITWAKSEQAMLQTVAIIFKIAQDPAGLTNDVAEEFNTKRNELLAAYDSAKKVATSTDLQQALDNGINKDSVIYYDLAGATAERIQESRDAIAAVVTQCTLSGIDVSEILGTKK